MKIALVQMNSTIGDFEGNGIKIVKLMNKALALGADLAVFPELCISGYPPMDLLDQERFVEEGLKTLRLIQRQAPADLGVILGYIDKNRTGRGKPLVNAASLIHQNKILFTQAKTLLPTYDVFDETRYFEPALERISFVFKGMRIGIAICEDVWWEQERSAGNQYPVDPVKELCDQGIELLVVPSASPYYVGKPHIRANLLSDVCRTGGIPVVYVNAVGGNDGLIFDGQSLAFSSQGRLATAGKPFEEEVLVFDTAVKADGVALPTNRYFEIEQALVLGIRDYMSKCGFKRAHLGLSGGIDSSIVAHLAVLALGQENVTGFALPSRYSSSGSLDDARELSRRLDIGLKIVSIETVFPHYLEALQPVFAGREPDITEENLQARIRGTILMAFANKFNSVLLNTGNKSELATGYCTLYGDMCGSLAVIGDLFKTEVYALARDMNNRYAAIPETVMVKAPSAELRHNQIDQDTLPPYDLLDRILKSFLIDNRSVEQIAASGIERAVVERVIKMVGTGEYKRRQAPPVLKVSERAFGTGRRMPIARRFYEL